MVTMPHLSRNELERIVSSVNSPTSTNKVPDSSVSRKEQLKRISDDRVATWGDTLLAKANQKLERKADKAREEEEQRRLQDIEDARLRENARVAAVKNAERLLAETTERVRKFKAQQLLVNTLDTRDLQIKEQEEILSRKAAMEQEYHERVMHDLQLTEDKMKQKQEMDKKKSMDLAIDLRKQRVEREERIRAQQQRQREEEEHVIQKIAHDDKQAEKAEVELRLERMRSTQEAMAKNALLMKQRQDSIQRQELEETKKAAEEAEKQSRINAARAGLEKHHFEEVNATRKMLSDKASAVVKSLQQRECELFDRDVAAKEEKEHQRKVAETMKLELDKIAVEESRKSQLLKKLQDQEVNKRLDDHYAQELLMKSMAQRELDQQKQLERRKQNIELLKLQQDQVRENEIRLAKEKEDALKEEQKVAKELSKEDDNFKEFVTKEIEMFKLQGKPKRGFLLEKTLKEKE